MFHPAFDVTPAELVTAIVTESGVVRGDYVRGLAKAVKAAQGAASLKAVTRKIPATKAPAGKSVDKPGVATKTPAKGKSETKRAVRKRAPK